jgi:TP901 family phage tail tape measure protein
MPERDDASTRIIGKIQLDTTLAAKSVKDLADEVRNLDKQGKEAARVAKEMESAWKQKAAQDAKIVKQTQAMWAEKARQDAARDKERLQHGLAVEREMANAEKERIQQSEQMWAQKAAQDKQRATEEARTAKEVNAAWAEKAKQDAQRETERLAHGLAVDKQLAAEAKKQAADSAAADKVRGASESSLPQLEAQLAAIQSRIKMERVGDGVIKDRLAVLRQETKEYQEQIALGKQLTAEQVKQVAANQAETKAIAAQVSTLAADQRGRFSSMLNRRLDWLFTGAVAFGGMQAIRAGIDDVSSIEMKMIELGRVMEDPLFKLEDMRKAIFELGQEFGFSFQDVHDVMLRWAQAGYDVKQSIELTRASLLALNTAELDAEQATQSLIGIMSQWGLQADQLTGVIDKINLVADQYAVTSQDLVDGLLRSSGAAKNANITLEQTIGLLTAMKTASGRSGKEVGNSLNSIISYMSKGKFLETLQGSGIPAFADAATDKLRPVYDIISDLAKNWDGLSTDVQDSMMEQADLAGMFSESMADATGTLEEWTDLQKRDIMQTGAGVYRRNYFIALLKNFAQVQEVVNTQEQALGYSMRENERTMQTASKKVESMKAAFQEFGYALAEDGGVLDSFKAAVDVGRSAVEWFNDLPPTLRKAAIATGLLMGSVGALNMAMKYTVGLGLAESLMGVRKQIQAMRDAGGLAAALKGGSAVEFAGILALLAIVGGAIYVMDKNVNRLQNTFAQLQSEMDGSIRSLEAQAKVHADNVLAIKKHADEWRALEKARQDALAGDDPDGVTRAADKQAQVIQQVTDALGEETAARLENAHFAEDAVDTVVNAEKEKTKSLRAEIDKQTADYKQALRDQIEEVKKSLKELYVMHAAWWKDFTFFDMLSLGWTGVIETMKKAWHNFLGWMFESSGKFTASLGETIGKVPFLKGMGDDLKSLSDGYMQSAAQHYLAAIESEDRMNGAVKSILDKRKIERQKLLADLYAELDKLNGGGGSGSGAGDGAGQFGTGDDGKGKIATIVDNITAETDAIGRRSDAIERDIAIRKERIAYLTREGASTEELLQADTERAALAGLLSDKQAVLHEQAESARAAYTALAEAQSKVNTSSEEGKKAYADLGAAMEKMLATSGGNSAEWLRIQKEKSDLAREDNAATRQLTKSLDDLKQMYDDGTIILDAYIFALEQLDRTTGAAASATKALNDEQAKAFKELWTSRITSALEKKKSDIAAQVKLLEDVLTLYDEAGRGDSRGDARHALEKAFGALQGLPTGATMPSMGGVQSLINDALAAFKNVDLGDLDPAAFASLMKSDLAMLKSFAFNAEGYLEAVGDATEDRLKAIANELKSIDRELETKLAALQVQLDALDAQDKQDERQKSTDEHTKRLKALHDQMVWTTDPFELAALRKQVAEEEQTWAEQRREWDKQDARESIQDQMDAARKEAELRKEKLQAEQEALQEQQRVMTEALQALLTYIKSEMEARKTALEDNKKDLEESSAAIDEALKGVDEKVVGQLAKMAALDPEFYKKASSLIGNIVSGINAGLPSLQSAINAVNSALSGMGTAGKTVTLPPVPVPSGGGGGGGNGRINMMAEGGFAKARSGGYLSILAEAGDDEMVLPRRYAVPMLSEALATVMRSSPSMPSWDMGALVGAIQRGLSAMQFYGTVDVRLPDGTIERQVVRLFSGLQQAVRV